MTRIHSSTKNVDPNDPIFPSAAHASSRCIFRRSLRVTGKVKTPALNRDTSPTKFYIPYSVHSKLTRPKISEQDRSKNYGAARQYREIVSKERAKLHRRIVDPTFLYRNRTFSSPTYRFKRSSRGFVSTRGETGRSLVRGTKGQDREVRCGDLSQAGSSRLHAGEYRQQSRRVSDSSVR